MITTTNIETSLVEIDNEFKTATPSLSSYWSKIAVIELGGWIEVCMDDILKVHSSTLIASSKLNAEFEEFVIGNYSFRYEKFRKCMIQLIGLSGVSKFEDYVGEVMLEKFSRELEQLASDRDHFAHHNLGSCSRLFPAPSVTRARLLNIKDGLKKVDEFLGTL